MSENLEGQSEEAVLRYRKLPTAERVDPKTVPRVPLTGESAVVAATFGTGVVAFAEEELRADVRIDAADDPWGLADDDEYPLPGAVSARQDERDRRQRRGGAGLALRGSGTRGGGGRTAGGTGGPAPMMGTPGATVGGVGAPAGVAGGSPAVTAMQSQGVLQQGAAQNSAATSASTSMLANAQSSSRAVSGAAFSPAAGTGVQAAGADQVAYDPELIRQALADNGFGLEPGDAATGRYGAGGYTSGAADGIVGSGSTAGSGTTPGSAFPGGGSGSGAGTDWPTAGPGTGSGGGTHLPGGPTIIDKGWPVPNTPDANNGAGSGGSGSAGPGTGAGTVTTPGSSSTGGGVNGAGGTGTTGGGSSGPSPAYRPSGAATYGYDVAPEDLRRDSRQWSEVSAMSVPIASVILSTPDPQTMFGHIKTPIPAYKVAVSSSKEFVEQSSGQQDVMADELANTALKFDIQEETAVALTKGMNQ